MEVLEEKLPAIFMTRISHGIIIQLNYMPVCFLQKIKCVVKPILSQALQRNVKSKKGIEKHKEQLKMLFFNPGKKIPGIPFIGDKIAIFDTDNAKVL